MLSRLPQVRALEHEHASAEEDGARPPSTADAAGRQSEDDLNPRLCGDTVRTKDLPVQLGQRGKTL